MNVHKLHVSIKAKLYQLLFYFNIQLQAPLTEKTGTVQKKRQFLIVFQSYFVLILRSRKIFGLFCVKLMVLFNLSSMYNK